MKNIASPIHRFIAAVVDGSVYLSLSLVLINQITNASMISVLLDNVMIAILVLLCWNIVLGVAKAVLTATLGGSIGKLVTGISVVDPNGNYLSIGRSFFRTYIGSIVASAPLFVGYVWIVIDRKFHRGWEDLVTDSFVVIKHKTGVFVGGFIMLVLIGLNIYLVNNILTNIQSNAGFYHEITSDVVMEVKKSFEPTPTPEIPASDKILPVNNVMQ